jgi:adenylate cyclase
LQRPSWATAAEAITIIIGTLLVGFLSLRTKALNAAIASSLLLVATLGGGWHAFREYGLLLNTVTPATVFLTTFVLCSLIHHFVSESEQRWIKAAFSRYVSPNRVAHLIDNPADIALGGHRQECSFIFTDLANFTRLMESIDPVEAVARLNAYLDGMIAIAFHHDGTLDRIVGDSVAIMFSAPVRQADHRARALACGMEMHDFASRYADELQSKGIDFGQTRIGIHSGEVIVGNVGGSTIFDYRALGDAVNTASRLEGVNKYLGTSICISEATLTGCPADTIARPIGKLVLKGKTEALQVYEPVPSNSRVHYAPEAEYRQAYDLMTCDDHASGGGEGRPALSAFRMLAEQYPDDPLVALHLRRLENGAQGDLIVMSEK